ncbi:polyhydroxybutyrate depolymerase [Streptomyces sp. A7024]|uniref:Polyhydroxybutyrate depolymerase n=1 Tax=Streptomyces coryli TaxID=1128680 RepID=A0A6G4U5R0_9ACTN|nr:PHB depolymerase family esterase [Streptomyces coryli]NGN67575.1 polyhydroxybutyrate depolymerase [Streptomyces coryli]
MALTTSQHPEIRLRLRRRLLRWTATAIAVALPALGLTALPAAAATESAPPPGDHQLSLNWQGKDRTFNLHVPPGAKHGKKLPLVVVMHWYPGTAEGIEAYSGFSRKADKEGFLVAYPQGLNGGYNALICCGNEDDVGFINEMVRQLVDDWRADKHRVYATGFSNGSDMSFRLAVERSKVFAAVAPVSGGYGGPLAENPDFMPSRPVPVVTILGADDDRVGLMLAGLDTWRQRLHCVVVDEDVRPGAYTLTKSRCADGSRVQAYLVENMAHEWPDNETHAVDATDVAWHFFKQHRR